MKLLLDKFREVWGNATDMERRVLGLAFEMDINEEGWTTQEYTLTDLVQKLGYARSGPALDKLRAVFKKFEAMGLMSSYPPRGKKRRLWFGYVLPEGSSLSHQQFFKVISDHITQQEAPEKSDLGSLPEGAEGEKSDLRSPAEKWKVILDHLGMRETDDQEVILDRILAALDLDDDHTSISTHEKSDHQINAPDLKKALGTAGIYNSFAETAIKKIEQRKLTLDDVLLIIQNAKAGKRLKDETGTVKVRNVPGFVLKCLGTSESGKISTNYLDEEAALKTKTEQKKTPAPELLQGLDLVASKIGRELTKAEALKLIDTFESCPNSWGLLEKAMKIALERPNVDNPAEYVTGILKEWQVKPPKEHKAKGSSFSSADLDIKPVPYTPTPEVRARLAALGTKESVSHGAT